MPLIDIQTFGYPEAVLTGVGDVEGELYIPTILSDELLIGVGDVTAVLDGYWEIITVTGVGDVEADLYTEAILETLVLTGVGDIFDVTLFVDTYQADFTFILDILPATAVPGTFIDWQPRLKVDGVEVAIIDGSFDQAEGVAADVLNVRLANVDDRILFTPTAVIEFGFGVKTAGVWNEDSFEICIAQGRLQDLTYTIGLDAGPTDTATVTVVSDSASKLMTTAEVDTIIYDSARDSVNPDDIEPLRDTAGRTFPPEIVGISGLKLHRLFQEVFINRCGFLGYKTNLPNYPVSRINAEMGSMLYESLGAHIGMFEPETFERDGIVWVIEMTSSMPPGFPAPLSVTVSQYQQLSRTTAPQNVDAIDMYFSEYGFDYDYITTDIETETTTEGDYELRTDTRWYEYRRFDDPYNYIRREKYFERKEWFKGLFKIRETVQTIEYDTRYRPSSVSYLEYDLLPDVTNVISPGVKTMMQTARQDAANQWSVHPFDVTRQFRAKRTVRRQVLIAQDNINTQLDEPFRREYKEVYEDGNLTTDHIAFFDTLSTSIETNKPNRDGTVEMTRTVINELGETIPVDDADSMAGDVSLNGLAMQQDSVLVFETDSSPRGTGQIVRFNVNELPMKFAKPLARRRIKRLRAGNNPLRITAIGPHFALRKGMPFNPTGRGGESFGICLVTGRKIRFSTAMSMTDITCREIG